MFWICFILSTQLRNMYYINKTKCQNSWLEKETFLEKVYFINSNTCYSSQLYVTWLTIHWKVCVFSVLISVSKGQDVPLFLCPGTRAGAIVPGQTPLSRDVPGQNELKTFKKRDQISCFTTSFSCLTISFPILEHSFLF